MLADNETYHQTESDVSTSWSHEPTPDHSTLVRHMQTIPPDWLDTILAETARRCLAEAGEATAPLGVDSSRVEIRMLSCPASGFCPDTSKDILVVPCGSHFGPVDSAVCDGNTRLYQLYPHAAL